MDTLGGAVVRSEFDFYGSVSVTSLAGVFDLKDRIQFNKQFLEAKKLFKGAGFEKSYISETASVITDTILSDTTKVDSVSGDTTIGAINDMPIVSDTVTSLPPDSLTITQPSDTLNTSLPDTTINDTSNVVHSDSAAVNQEEEPHTGEETNTEEESPSEQTDNTP